MPVEGIKGTAPDPIRLPLERATKLAERIRDELQGFCSVDAEGIPKIAIAGSIRRRRPEVGDIDLVCLPKDEAHRWQIRERMLRTSPWILQDGAQTLVVVLDTKAGPIQVDTWFAQHEDRHMFGFTPGNFGSLLLLRTGSREHNIWMIQQLGKRGYQWRTNAGVWLNGRCLAGEDERDFFRLIEHDFIKPEDRER